MKQYYYVNKSGQQAGPVPAEKFSACGIMKDTLVWCEGMDEWKKVEDVAELKYCKVPDSSFPSTIEYKANFNEGLISIGGKIIITPDLIIFRAHSINLGDLSDRVFKIQDVSGYRKGILTFLYIQFKDGYEIKLTVWNKQEIITEIENRRKHLIAYT